MPVYIRPKPPTSEKSGKVGGFFVFNGGKNMDPLNGILEKKYLNAIKMAFTVGVDVPVIYEVIHDRISKTQRQF